MKIEFNDDEVKRIILEYVNTKVTYPLSHKVAVEGKDYSYRGLSVVVSFEKSDDEAKD